MSNKKLSILGLIPARGGSKGIQKKNIYPVNGKPLIWYTIEASLDSKLISKTIVTSDDDEILEISKKYGSDVLSRPPELASDEATSESLIIDAILKLKEINEFFDIFILLQPTSPLRDSNDIDNAIRLMIKHKAEGVISVMNVGNKPFKSYYIGKEGFLKGVHNNQTPNMRRQDLPDAFLANGAIYAAFTEQFLKASSFLPKKTVPYIMSNIKSYDIDTLEDIDKVESILKTQY